MKNFKELLRLLEVAVFTNELVRSMLPLGPAKVVVPVSGGKDSQACLKLAIAHVGVENVLGLFCDTQFEHPTTYEHVEWMRMHYGVRIHCITGGSVVEKVEKYGRFPGGGSRHCTDELKMRITRDFCREYATLHGGFEVWYGMRSDESSERKTRYAGRVGDDVYPAHEVFPKKYPKYLETLGVMFRLPVLECSKADIFEYLNGEQHPLYNEGFDRIGCFPCLAGGDTSKEKAFAYDDFGQQQQVKVIFLSAKIGKSIWTSNGGKARNEGNGCAICSY